MLMKKDIEPWPVQSLKSCFVCDYRNLLKKGVGNNVSRNLETFYPDAKLGLLHQAL